MLRCEHCGKRKLIAEFYNTTNQVPKNQTWCKKCQSHLGNPEKVRKSQIKTYLKRYNLTPEQYNKMFEQQNGCCAICGKHQSELTIRLAVDHNHQTGEVRGLLCGQCNMLLGRYELLQKNINEYLSQV